MEKITGFLRYFISAGKCHDHIEEELAQIKKVLSELKNEVNLIDSKLTNHIIKLRR